MVVADVAELARSRRGYRALQAFVLLLTLVIVVGTPIIDSSLPGPLTELQKKRADKRFERASFADGTRGRLLETRLRRSSSTRDFVSKLYTLQLYLWLRESHSERAFEGRDGWFFMLDRTQPPDLSSTQFVEEMSASLLALDRELRLLGVQVIFIPLPRRAVVEARHLPTFIDPRSEIDRMTARVMREYGLQAVDLFPAFTDWQGPTLFYQKDTHWNQLGEKLAAEEALRQYELLVPQGQRKGILRQVGVEPQGTYADTNHDFYRILEIRPNEGTPQLAGPSTPVFSVAPRKEPVVRQGPSRSVALTGSSFSSRGNFGLFLKHFGRLNLANASVSAKGPIEPIRRLLANRSKPLPELILAEVPIFSFLVSGNSVHEEVTRLIAENPPLNLAPFGPVDFEPLALSSSLGEEFSVGESESVIARVPVGALLSTFDNLVGLRLNCEVQRGAVRLRLRGESSEPAVNKKSWGHKSAAPRLWEVGDHECYLPIIARGSAEGGLRLSAIGSGEQARARIRNLQFVTTVDLDRAIPLGEVDSNLGPQRWSVDFELSVANSARPDRVLVVGPWDEDSWTNDVIVIEVLDLNEDTISRELIRGHIAPGGWVFVSLLESGLDAGAIIRFSGAKRGKLPKILPRVSTLVAPAKR